MKFDEDKKTTLPCCGCSGEVTFVHPDAGPQPTLFHTMPYCERFDSIKTIDGYLEYFKDCGAKKGRN